MNGLLYEKLVFREIWQPFFITLGGLCILFLMGRLLIYIEPLLNAGITLRELGKLVLLMIPVFLMVVLPIATLLGSLLASMRLSRESEMIALFACGVTTSRLLRPFFFFALVSWMATFFTATEVVPIAKSESKAFLREITESVLARGFPEKVFFSPHEKLTFYVDRTDKSGKNFQGVYIRDTRLDNMPYQIFARRGRLAVKPDKQAIVLKLEEGTMTSPGGSQIFNLLNFDTYALSLTTPVNKHSRKRGEMGLKELYVRGNDPHLKPEKARVYLTEFHKRISLPTGALIFGVAALPIGIFLGRSGISAGVAAGLSAFLVYYMAIILSTSIAEEGIIPPFISLWIPNLLFGGLTVWLIKRLSDRGPLSD